MAPSVDPADSRRLAVLRWPLIVAVVFIHANNDRMGLPAPEGGAGHAAWWVHVLRKALSEGLAATAVPLFFLMAGYLFFVGPPLNSATYGAKLRRRARTLLVPYLFWNLLLALVLALAMSVPALRPTLSGPLGSFVHEGPWAWIEALLGIGRAPVVYPLWFVRDLMLAVLLAPVGAALFRLGPVPTVIGLGALLVPWIGHAWPWSIPSGAALLFFFLGGAVGARGGSLFAWSRQVVPHATRWLGLLYLPWILVESAGLAGPWYPTMHQLGILLGVAFVLGLAVWVESQPRWGGRLIALSGASFFLFVVHEPALTLVLRLGARVLPVQHPLVDLGLYFAAVAAVVCLGTLGHRWLSAQWPVGMAWVTGGRRV